MKAKLLLSLILICSLWAGALAAAKPLSDDALYDLVRRRLTSDTIVKGGALEVDVKSGVVTLRGSVELEKQKIRAEKIARKVGGVKSVVNELTVRRRK
ncbi:MAG: BON domain-containing protein [Candidatus Solibacter usitatus]|nr:BON domain-containing protein [Candidatus Solibacter usitatus]